MTDDERRAFVADLLGSATKYLERLRREQCMTINELVTEAYATATAHGFHDGEVMNVGEKLALIHSEISEALEAHRAGYTLSHCLINGKPEGFAIELADAVIRIADLCGAMQLDLEEAIRLKLEFNKTRPYKHNRSY